MESLSVVEVIMVYVFLFLSYLVYFFTKRNWAEKKSKKNEEKIISLLEDDLKDSWDELSEIDYLNITPIIHAKNHNLNFIELIRESDSEFKEMVVRNLELESEDTIQTPTIIISFSALVFSIFGLLASNITELINILLASDITESSNVLLISNVAQSINGVLFTIYIGLFLLILSIIIFVLWNSSQKKRRITIFINKIKKPN